MKTIFLKWAAIMIAASFAFTSCSDSSSSDGGPTLKPAGTQVEGAEVPDGFTLFSDLNGTTWGGVYDAGGEKFDVRIKFINGPQFVFAVKAPEGWFNVFSGDVYKKDTYTIMYITWSDDEKEDEPGEYYYMAFNAAMKKMLFTGGYKNDDFDRSPRSDEWIQFDID